MYFIRYIVWFLLFSTKKVEKEIIESEYNKIFKWLETRFPNYKKNRLLKAETPPPQVEESQKEK